MKTYILHSHDGVHKVGMVARERKEDLETSQSECGNTINVKLYNDEVKTYILNVHHTVRSQGSQRKGKERENEKERK